MTAKKIRSTVVGVFLLIFILTQFTVKPFAAEADKDADSVTAYVTVYDGELRLVRKAIDITDSDEDGSISAADALYCAHKLYFSDGDDVGFEVSTTETSAHITRLWGLETGKAYGCYVNNISIASVTAPIKDGDSIYAFAYTDTSNLSDVYSYFDVETASLSYGESLTLTLKYMKGDTAIPLEGAIITINGVETDRITDANGSVTLKPESSGEITISATSAHNLIPPICVLNVSKPSSGAQSSASSSVGEKETPPYGIMMAACAVVTVAASAAAIALSIKKGRKNL